MDAIFGGIQASYGWAGYSAGKQPAFSVLTDLTGAWNNEMEAFNFYYYGGGLELLNKLERGKKGLGLFGWQGRIVRRFDIHLIDMPVRHHHTPKKRRLVFRRMKAVVPRGESG